MLSRYSVRLCVLLNMMFLCCGQKDHGSGFAYESESEEKNPIFRHAMVGIVAGIFQYF